MRYVRYLVFMIASVAAVAGMIWVERETPVVRTVKSTLGLEVPQDAGHGDGAGMMSMVAGLISGIGQAPDLSGILAGRSEKSAGEALPPALQGWMREDRDFDINALLDFEDSFYPDRAERSTSFAQTVEGSVNGERIADYAQRTMSDSRGLVGAVYFRGDMKMLVTVSDPARLVSAVPREVRSAREADEVVNWQGQLFKVTRDAGNGFAKAGVQVSGSRVFGFLGNVPTQVIQDYLNAMSGAPAFIDLVPEALAGWRGAARGLTYDDVLAFDATFAPDGKQKRMVREELGYLKTALDNGMQIAGALLEKDDMRLLVTLTRLPDVRRDDNPMGGAGILVASGLLQLTRSFETDLDGLVELDGQNMSVSTSPDGTYRTVGHAIGGAYLFELRGNVPQDILSEYTQALDLEAVKAAAKLWNPDWET